MESHVRVLFTLLTLSYELQLFFVCLEKLALLKKSQSQLPGVPNMKLKIIPIADAMYGIFPYVYPPEV